MKITKEEIDELVKESESVCKDLKFTQDELDEAEKCVSVVEGLEFDLESFRIGLLFGAAAGISNNEEYLLLVVNTISKRLKNK